MLVYLLPHRLRQKLAEHTTLAKLLNLFLFFLGACLFFAVSFKYAEKVDWEEAIWQVWQTVTTVGYGNRPAASTWGRIATMLFGLAGIALLGALISTWFDWRSDARDHKRYGHMENPHKNGYVIINFPGISRFTALVTELAAIEKQIDVCVVSSQLDEMPVSVLHLPKVRLHFVRGSLLAEKTYEQACIEDARAIFVFPQNTGVAESDATTKMVVEIVGRLTSPRTRILHVLVEPANEWLFEGSRSASIYETDEILLLVQEAHDARSAPLMQNLLLTSRGANPRTVVPRHIIGWSWGTFQRACLDAAERDSIAINPLAILKGNGAPEPCPLPNALIEEGDSLSLIVHNDFDWDRFEQALSSKNGARTGVAASGG